MGVLNAKNRDYSKWLKFLLGLMGLAMSVLSWFGLLGNATIDDIWKAVGLAYAVMLGVMDYNISRDSRDESAMKRKAEADAPAE